MTDDRRPFQTFIIRAHRRRVAWHFLEYISIALLVTSALMLILLPIAWWQGKSMEGPAIIMLGLVPFIAIAYAIPTRPKLFDTVSMIDRQLDAHDLLSTALLANRKHEFSSALYAMADARVCRVAIGSLTLRRFGPRTFISAGLAGTCAIIVAMMVSSVGVERPAVANPSGTSVDQWINERDVAESAISMAGTDHASRPSQPDPSSARPGLSNDSSSGTGRANDQRSDTGPNASAGTRGSGAARSDSSSSPPPDAPQIASSQGTGTLAAGGIGTAANTSVNHASAGGAVTTDERTTPIPPWQSTTWSRDRAAALQAVQNGGVPDPYRSLVQDYFDRP